MKVKKLLKGTHSQENRNFEGGKGKHQFCNVWTADGKISYKDGNDNKAKIYYD